MIWAAVKLTFFCLLFVFIFTLIFDNVWVPVVFLVAISIGVVWAVIVDGRRSRAALALRVQADIDARKRQLIHETPDDEWGIVDLDS